MLPRRWKVIELSALAVLPLLALCAALVFIWLSDEKPPLQTSGRAAQKWTTQAPTQRADGVLAGTGAAIPLLELLAHEFRASGGAALRIAGSIGSGGGLAALEDRMIPCAFTSRPPKDREAPGASVWPFARTRVALAADAGFPLEVLGRDDLRGLLQGARVKGLAIRPVLREEGDSGTTLFLRAFPELAEAFRAGAGRLQTVFTDQDMIRMLLADPMATGLLDEGMISLAGGRLKKIPLGSAAMPEKTLYLVCAADAPKQMMEFVGFVSGPKGRALTSAAGYALP